MYDNWFTTGQSAADGVGTYSRFPARFSIVFQLKAKFCGVIKCHVTGRRARKPAAPLHDPCPKGHVSCRVVSRVGHKRPRHELSGPPRSQPLGQRPPRAPSGPPSHLAFSHNSHPEDGKGAPLPPLSGHEKAQTLRSGRESLRRRDSLPESPGCLRLISFSPLVSGKRSRRYSPPPPVPRSGGRVAPACWRRAALCREGA